MSTPASPKAKQPVPGPRQPAGAPGAGSARSEASVTAPRRTSLLERLRVHLAQADALAAVSALALVVGVITGLVVVVFRLITERLVIWAGLLPDAAGFESLPWPLRLVLPIAGGLAIGLLFQAVPASARAVGPVHVMTRLAYHGARLPLANALMQFVGAAIAIVSGHSVGREGPVIHMGAASASLLGQRMRLPNNSIRTLVAAGIAAAIAASFNTPIAGVVFAMEVVMLEYTLVGFAPVIIAAVSATTVSRLFFGPDPAIAVPTFQLSSLLELPWVVALGLVISCLAAAYVWGIVTLERRTNRWPLWVRTTSAGAFVGLCALVVPQVMGLGYDTAQAAMLGDFTLGMLLLITLAKLLATVACGGLGVPAGMIGPMVVIGATAGGALGIIGQELVPSASSPSAFYATLGVVAMMGACLHAPLAALMAILELTANPNTILPGMAAVITAFLMSRVVFRQKPLFVAILALRGIDYRFDPVALALERTGVRAVMSRRTITVEAGIDLADLEARLAFKPDWVLLAEGREIVGAWPADAVHASLASARAGIASATERQPAAEPGAAEPGGPAPVQETDPARPTLPSPPLLPTDRWPFVTVSVNATLGEALAQLDKGGADIVLVGDVALPRRRQIQGVLSRQQIESTVRYRG